MELAHCREPCMGVVQAGNPEGTQLAVGQTLRSRMITAFSICGLGRRAQGWWWWWLLAWEEAQLVWFWFQSLNLDILSEKLECRFPFHVDLWWPQGAGPLVPGLTSG